MVGGRIKRKIGLMRRCAVLWGVKHHFPGLTRIVGTYRSKHAGDPIFGLVLNPLVTIE